MQQVAAAAVSLFAGQVLAIEGLQISVHCPDVVLSWPSVAGETYMVQYRPDLNPGTGWVTLTNSLPDSGTGLTMFVHSNMVLCLQGSGGSGTNGGGPPPSPFTASSLTTGGSGSLTPWQAQGRPPYPWELQDRPPYPWETGASIPNDALKAPSVSLTGNSPTGFGPLGGGSSTSAGFYRVVRAGARLLGVTDGMTLSGRVAIAVEVGNDAGYLANLSMTENGCPVSSDSVHLPPFELPVPWLIVDTTQMTNGGHQISASATWHIGGAEGSGGDPTVQADSPPVSVNVYNEISFPNWMGQFGQLGNSLLVTAQSAHPNTDWYVDFYGSQYQFIGTMNGHTSDGTIEVVWDLIGPDNQLRTDPFFAFVVRTAFGSAVAPLTYRNTDPWPGPGDWVVVNQQAWNDYLGHENLDTITDGFVAAAQAVPLAVRPTPNAGQAYRLHFQDPQGTYDWQAFRQALYYPLSRNLFYLGHADANGLGYDPASPTGRYISAHEIATSLYTIPANQTNRHAYRFVFLDGCASAGGTLPESFGIKHQENVPSNYYYEASLRPSAFVGWASAKTIGFGNHVILTDHWQFIQDIQYGLSQGWSIKVSVNYAASRANPLYINASDLKIFGDWDLTYWAFNQ